MESYPSSFNSEFWLKKRVCTVGIALGKTDPLSASARTVPSLLLSAPLGGLTVNRSLAGGGWCLFCRRCLPPSENWHHCQRRFLAAPIKICRQSCRCERCASWPNSMLAMAQHPPHGCWLHGEAGGDAGESAGREIWGQYSSCNWGHGVPHNHIMLMF